MRPFTQSFTLCIIAFSFAASIEAAEDDGSIELLRDRWGVPHVFAETDAGAMFGLGYATAEDRAFQMHLMLRVIQGRLAETIGDVKKARRDETALDNDRKMRTFGFYRAAKETARNLDDDSRQLLEAYSAGVNRYMEKHPDKLHPLFAKFDLKPEPWTPADCLVSWWHLAQFFATDGTRDLMHYRNLTQGTRRDPRQMAREMAGARGGRGGGAEPADSTEDLTPLGPDDAASVVQRGDVNDAWIARTHEYLRGHGYEPAQVEGAGQGGSAGPKFSHAWVAGSRVTGTGAATLVSKPQTPVTNPSLLYEFHISGKTFDVRGCGVPGSPVILIGFNRHVAWGMTALGADQADLFRLKTDADRPDSYQFAGDWLPIKTTREEIKVRGGRTQTIGLRHTRFGPIVNEFAFSRPGDPPVALKRIPTCEIDRETIQGALAMMRATSAQEFFDALPGWRFPTANVIFGDDQGNIGYSTAGALPLRSAEALEVGGAAHDGSASRFDWQDIIPAELVPHVINPEQGYLFSGNHRPIQSFYPIPIGIRTGSGGDTLRSLRLRQMFAEYESLAPKDILRMNRDAVNPARKAIVQVGFHLSNVLKQKLSKDAETALAFLQDWYADGSSAELTQLGAVVALQINTMFRFVNTPLAFKFGGGDSGMSRMVKTWEGRLAADPKAEFTPLERQYVDEVLAGALNSCFDLYGLDPETWLASAQDAVAARRLGAFAGLDGFPSVDSDYDLSMPPLACTDGATISSQGAEAYVQWVPLHDVDRAQSILPPGQSELPDHPTRLVNVELWTEGKLHPAPLSRRAVNRITKSRTTLAK
jgi:penicillin amidase